MEEERDMVVFSDDEGNEFELEAIDYFDYEGQEYVVLADPEAYEYGCGDAPCEHQAEVCIMKVVVSGEFEELLPADDDKLAELTAIVEQRFAAFDEEDDEDEDDEDDEAYDEEEFDDEEDDEDEDDEDDDKD